MVHNYYRKWGPLSELTNYYCNWIQHTLLQSYWFNLTLKPATIFGIVVMVQNCNPGDVFEFKKDQITTQAAKKT